MAGQNQGQIFVNGWIWHVDGILQKIVEFYILCIYVVILMTNTQGILSFVKEWIQFNWNVV